MSTIFKLFFITLLAATVVACDPYVVKPLHDDNFDREAGIENYHYSEYAWKDFDVQNGTIPANVVRGSNEAVRARTFFICRVHLGKSILPGQTIGRKCEFTKKNRAYRTSHYQLLVGQGVRWINPTAGAVPETIIPAGKNAQGDKLYICRASVGGWPYTGRLENGHCYVAYKGRARRQADFQMLVVQRFVPHLISEVTRTIKDENPTLPTRPTN